MKNLSKLQDECATLGLHVETKGRSSKEPYIAALRDYHWRKDHPDQPLPPQIEPMLLGSWEDLEEEEARRIEEDYHAWIIEPKLDGVRALIHIEDDQVRITSRTVSEVTYRLSELQDNLAHLTEGLSGLAGTVMDGELLCPVPTLNTGSTVAMTSLQATMAVLAAAPDKAHRIQEEQNAHLRLHVFDILRYRGQDLTQLPLIERQDFLVKASRQWNNSCIETVPNFVVNKPEIHRRIIQSGGEGSVWKRADSPYQPGRRMPCWVKRKRGIEVEAFISDAKPGTNGHASVVGAVQFSIRQADGSAVPIAWVCSLSDKERLLLTDPLSNGDIRLAPDKVGKRAILVGQDLAPRSRRIRHARLERWLDDLTC